MWRWRELIFAVLCIALLIVLLLAALRRVAGAAVYDSIIVQFAPGSSQKQEANWRTVYGQPGRYVIPIETSKAGTTLNAYAARPDVTLAEPNYTVTLDDPAVTDAPGLVLSSVNDPRAGEQYGLNRINVYAAWDISRGNDVTIASVDTGVDCSHADLAAKCLGGMDFVNDDSDASDDNGHGTHVSGTFGSATNNGLGGAGVGYSARILPVKVLGSGGSGDHATIASGIRWATDHGARVINLSLGGPFGSDTLKSAIDYALSRHVVVVAAAGNDGSRQDLYPAAYPGVISVCATDASDRVASFSNVAASVDVCAPGVSILSTTFDGGYGTKSGTSMAAPHVSGLAALVLAAHPGYGEVQVKAAIEGSADAVVSVGRGRVNAARALGVSAPNPTPQPTRPPASDDYAAQVVAGINAARAQYALAPFRRDSHLDAAAEFHNRFMVNDGCFAHVCNGEPDPFQRMRNAGYSLVAGSEVIAAGYQTPTDAVNGWLNSPGHRAIILGGHRDIGCDYLYSPSTQYGFYWTCDTGISNETPIPQPTITTPTPIGTPTLPANWQMSIHLPYNRFTWTAIHDLYLQFCVGLAGQGATCTWERTR